MYSYVKWYSSHILSSGDNLPPDPTLPSHLTSSVAPICSHWWLLLSVFFAVLWGTVEWPGDVFPLTALLAVQRNSAPAGVISLNHGSLCYVLNRVVIFFLPCWVPSFQAWHDGESLFSNFGAFFFMDSNNRTVSTAPSSSRCHNSGQLHLPSGVQQGQPLYGVVRIFPLKIPRKLTAPNLH